MKPKSEIPAGESMSAAERITLEWEERPDMRAPCQSPDCRNRARWVRTWKTEQMPAPAFYYVCARHLPPAVKEYVATVRGSRVL